MSNNKKILIITPRFPIPTKGACEQDRLSGVKQFKRLGYDILIITKVFNWQDIEIINKFGKENNIIIKTSLYQSEIKKIFWKKILFYLRRFINPFYWDGAAYEYAHKDIKNLVKNAISDFKPDVAWFD